MDGYCYAVWSTFSFNWGTNFICGDSWHFRLVGVLYLGVVILFWLSDWFGFDQWLSLDGLCCPESLSSLNSLTREEDVQCCYCGVTLQHPDREGMQGWRRRC